MAGKETGQIAVGLLVTLAAFAGCGGGSRETGAAGAGGTPVSPKNLAQLQARFQSAIAKPTPWAGYWWPYSTNGIAAAASLYDAVRGGGSATPWEIAHHGLGLGAVMAWWGHCNGWSAAAVLTPEPRASVSLGSTRFGIADRKALLTEIHMEVTGDVVGRPVTDPGDFSSPAFLDVVPAQFHIALANVMGNQQRGLIVDRYTGYEVWNQPLAAYFIEPITRADDLGADPSAPGVYRVNVTATIWWVSDNVDPSIVTPAFNPSNPDPVFESRMLRYELWLDAPPVFDGSGVLVSSGDIILGQDGDYAVGGVWKNDFLPLVSSYPDYMWAPAGPARSSGYKNPYIEDEWLTSNLGSN